MMHENASPSEESPASGSSPTPRRRSHPVKGTTWVAGPTYRIEAVPSVTPRFGNLWSAKQSALAIVNASLPAEYVP